MPIDQATFAKIEKAWHEHLVIVLRGQHLDEEAQLRFARRFGELSPVMNVVPLGEIPFHSDECYQECPAMGTMLYAIEIPADGANSLFANGYNAYEALAAHIKDKISGRKAMNVYPYEGVLESKGMVARERGMSYAHPVVRTHPATGRKSLYVNRLMTHHIEGLPVDDSLQLLTLLFEALERPEFIYEHRWRVGDVVLWDNRCTLHARRDFDPNERRWMRRVTIKGDQARWGIPISPAAFPPDGRRSSRRRAGPRR